MAIKKETRQGDIVVTRDDQIGIVVNGDIYTKDTYLSSLEEYKDDLIYDHEDEDFRQYDIMRIYHSSLLKMRGLKTLSFDFLAERTPYFDREAKEREEKRIVYLRDIKKIFGENIELVNDEE